MRANPGHTLPYAYLPDLYRYDSALLRDHISVVARERGQKYSRVALDFEQIIDIAPPFFQSWSSHAGLHGWAF